MVGVGEGGVLGEVVKHNGGEVQQRSLRGSTKEALILSILDLKLKYCNTIVETRICFQLVLRWSHHKTFLDMLFHLRLPYDPFFAHENVLISLAHFDHIFNLFSVPLSNPSGLLLRA